MEQMRSLIDSHHVGSPRKADAKRDKLAETKRAERELKERTTRRLKAEQRLAKEKKREAAHVDAQKHREHRALTGSQTKRASKDAREALRREAQKEGQTCQHGVWKCQICYPQPRTGKVSHNKDANLMVDAY